MDLPTRGRACYTQAVYALASRHRGDALGHGLLARERENSPPAARAAVATKPRRRPGTTTFPRLAFTRAAGWLALVSSLLVLAPTARANIVNIEAKRPSLENERENGASGSLSLDLSFNAGNINTLTVGANGTFNYIHDRHSVYTLADYRLAAKTDPKSGGTLSELGDADSRFLHRALGHLRSWSGGRGVLVSNADAWLGPTAGATVAELVEGWDREHHRLLCVRDARRGDFGDLRYCGVALVPAAAAARLEAVPSGLYEVAWREAWEAGALDLVEADVAFVDCGTPADYLRANLEASGGASVIGSGASVASTAVVECSVVWDGARVDDGEVLVRGVRTPEGTVLVR